MLQRLKEYWRESLDLAQTHKDLERVMPDRVRRKELLERFTVISRHIGCLHNPSHILSFVNALLALPASTEGCIVEAGTYKGGSAAKFSVVAKMLNRPWSYSIHSARAR
jgi:hypothetical protein